MNKLRVEKRKLIKQIQASTTVKQIQAYYPEGHKQDVLLESLLTGEAVNISIPGTINAYKNYLSQVSQIYRKYNGHSDFGTQQTRTVVDLRTAFIAGEGINVSAEKEKTALWIEKFLRLNKLNSMNLLNMVKGSEMAGQSLLTLKLDSIKIINEPFVKVFRIPFNHHQPYTPKYNKTIFHDEVIDIVIEKQKGQPESLGLKNFIYVRTGGDDTNFWGPTPKVGIVLTDIENYDRAVKDQRRINHIMARITPSFKVEDAKDVKELQAQLTDIKWKIGKTYIGSAEFDYKTPKTGAHDILNSEMVATIKTISSVTGVPVHWLGYVDLMSNRSTAETLYEFLKNATSSERLIWEDSLYDLILKAQEIYINEGNDLELDPDFQVKLPLLDFANFLERIRAYSMAYKDEAISIDDYRNGIPGIDPLKTKKAIEKTQKEAESDMMRKSEDAIKNNFQGDDENDNQRITE